MVKTPACFSKRRISENFSAARAGLRGLNGGGNG